MMFPSEICNSVSPGIFREFRPFSAIAENHWPMIIYFNMRDILGNRAR